MKNKKITLKEIVIETGRIGKESGKKIDRTVDYIRKFITGMHTLPTSFRRAKNDDLYFGASSIGLMIYVGIYPLFVMTMGPGVLAIPIVGNSVSGVYEVGRYIRNRVLERRLNYDTGE